MPGCNNCRGVFDNRGIANHMRVCGVPGGDRGQAIQHNFRQFRDWDGAAAIRLFEYMLSLAIKVLMPFGRSPAALFLTVVVVWPWVYRATCSYVLGPLHDAYGYAVGMLSSLVSVYEFLGLLHSDDEDGFTVKNVLMSILQGGLKHTVNRFADENEFDDPDYEEPELECDEDDEECL